MACADAFKKFTFVSQMTSSISAAGPPITPPSQSAPRPLQREGARYFPSAAERAMEAAMLRSSSPPVDPVLRKRAREGDDLGDQGDTEPEDEGSASQEATADPPPPSLGNVITATSRYAAKKKLRPEQRDEVEVFLLVSSSLYHLFANTTQNCWLIGYSTWSAG